MAVAAKSTEDGERGAVPWLGGEVGCVVHSP